MTNHYYYAAVVADYLTDSVLNSLLVSGFPYEIFVKDTAHWMWRNPTTMILT
jgi:hypothetical protein